MTGAIPLSNTVNIFLVDHADLAGGHPQAVSLMFPPITYYVCLALFLLAAPMSIYVGLIVTVALEAALVVGRVAGARLLGPAIHPFKAVYQLFFRPFY